MQAAGEGGSFLLVQDGEASGDVPSDDFDLGELGGASSCSFRVSEGPELVFKFFNIGSNSFGVALSDLLAHFLLNHCYVIKYQILYQFSLFSLRLLVLQARLMTQVQIFLHHQAQQFSNAFHLFSSRNSSSVSKEVQKILQHIKPELLRMFDKFQQENQSLILEAISQVRTFMQDKILEFYSIQCPFPVSESIRWTISAFREEWKNLRNNKTVQNIWNEGSMSVDECVCGQDHTSGEKEFCYSCGRLFHSFCYWTRDRCRQQYFECPFCFVRNCSPDRKVESIFFAAYLSPTVDKTNFSFSFLSPIQPLFNEQNQIQIRCVRFDSTARFQLTWPSFCDIVANGQELGAFKPLPLNSPLKKRVDNPIRIPSRLMQNQCTMKLCEYASPSASPSWHMIAVCKIRKIQQTQILMVMAQNRLSQQSSINSLQVLLKKSDQEVQVDEIKIVNRCQYYGQNIRFPARSVMCLTHLQPFDLSSLIYSSIKAVSSSRKWKCPVCGVRSYDSRIDTLVTSLLREHCNIKQISFDKTLTATLYYEDEPIESDSDEDSDNQIAVLNLEDGPI